MSSSDSHSIHSDYDEKFVLSRLDASSSGSHRVRYNPDAAWDYALHVPNPNVPIDISLVLPHFRAMNQPSDHRMNMYIGGQGGPIQAKICRKVCRTKFYLEIRSGSSDVTVYLPSDFKGQIRHSGKAYFSPGFVDFILPHCRVNKRSRESCDEDQVVVSTHGKITFRMWDILAGIPEPVQKVPAIMRLFGQTNGRRSPESHPVHVKNKDWDFLLDN